MPHISNEKKKTSLRMKYFLVTFCTYSIFFVDHVSAECREQVEMLPRNSYDSKIFRNLYIFENDTQKCNEAEAVLISSRPSFCDSRDLNVTFSSVAVLPSGINILPYILLNVSIWINNPVSSVFLRLECLEAPNLEDDYCHDHEEQYRRWGRMIWPCRSLTLSEPDLVNYPYFFGYHCFRLSSYSHYRLNVSCAPNLCRKSFIVTIPEETQVHPAINRFYNRDAATGENYWSPLVSVDLTLQDRVVIRYERQPSFVAARISVAVFETIASSSFHLFTDTLDADAVEYEWKNVPAGNFTAYLYVSRIDCNLICSSDTSNECILCPNTRIHFTVEEKKILFSVSVKTLSFYGIYITGAAILCFIATMAFWIFFWTGKCCQKVSLPEVSFSQRTTVFIVYTDDCEPHSDCITVLAEILQRDANVDVFIDQFELKCSEALPLRWCFNKFAVANHVMLIFSEGANAILRGESLIQRQPFPEFFSIALNMLITECSKDVAKQSVKLLSEVSLRFTFAHMTYSPSSVIPEEFSTLPINTFKLPEQVENLISWLHNQPSDISVDMCVDISHLKNAINKVVEYRHRNPNWLAERLQTMRKNSESGFAPENVPFQVSRSMLIPEEQVHIAETLNLEPPDIHTSMVQMSHAAKRRKAITKRVQRKHACPNCDARFPFPNKLRLHINSNHSLANICELCPERFNRFNELRTHMRYAHQIIHQCHLCAYSSSVKAELKKHVVKCHDNGVRCTVDGCAATVAYNRLRRHIKETHCNKPESNLIADGQILEDSLELKNNLIEDSSTGTKFFSPAERSIATNAFSGVEFVSIHDNLLSMDKMQEPISNCISSKTSSQNAETFSHLSATVQHDEATAENCTDRCDRIESGKAFKMERDNSENISREQSLETPTQPDGLEIKDQTISEEISFDCIETGGYKCQECGKIFYDVCKSRRHWNRVHFKRYKERVRLKKYACKISGCTQCFSCPSKLQDHISTAHNEEARFDCETCSRKFRSRSSFAVHLRRYHLVSIRDVPYGFTKGTGISSNNISDEACVIAQNIVGKTEFVTTENIFAKE